MAFISRKHLQFPISSVPRIMPLARGMLGMQSMNTVWVLNVFSRPWTSKWFLATSTWLKLSGGAVRMQGIHNDCSNLLFNPHVNCHTISCTFKLIEFYLFACVLVTAITFICYKMTTT